jgi:phage shock protein C
MTATPAPQPETPTGPLAGARAWFARKALTRPARGRILGGVSAGFARRVDVDPLVARLLVIAVILVLSPLAYLVTWILMPADGYGSTSSESPNSWPASPSAAASA